MLVLHVYRCLGSLAHSRALAPFAPVKVLSVYIDCDNDSIIYLGEPVGPSCHTGAYTCFYTRVDGERGVSQGGDGQGAEAALTTLFQLEAIIDARGKEEVAEGAKPSWTRKLLDKPELLCSKVRTTLSPCVCVRRSAQDYYLVSMF
jgi:hypothetical protein